MSEGDFAGSSDVTCESSKIIKKCASFESYEELTHALDNLEKSTFQL